MPISFGLSLPKKPGSAAAPPVRPRPAFGFDEDEDDKTTKPLPPKATLPSKSIVAQPKKKQIEAAEELDPSIYDYDAAYDALHAKDAEKKAAQKAAAEDKRSQYMEGLIASADVRKRDQLQYREKVLQREREAEGEDFADKLKFVTGAYKKQQEENKVLEEEERRKEEEEAKTRKTMGMASLHKNILGDRERRYEETIAAAAEAEKRGPASNDEPKEKSDIELAKEMIAKGADIKLNDEGQLVDERQLLRGGLNVAPKPKKVTAAATSSRPQQQAAAQPAWQGKDGARRAQRERQTRMIEAQLEQASKRTADDEADKERELEHKSKSTKTQSDVSSARERYLQRQKDAAAKKAAERDGAA